MMVSSNISTVEVTITSVNDAPESESLIVDVQSNTHQFDLSQYISDIDHLSDDLILTFLPEENNGDIVGASFYGGEISYNNTGFIFDYITSENPPLEDFILFKVSDGELESEPALITFNIPFLGLSNQDQEQIVPFLKMLMQQRIQRQIFRLLHLIVTLNFDNNFPSDGNGVEVDVVWGPFHGN